MPWYTYIIRCNDQSFYAGHTGDLQQRIDAHNSGHGAVYTKQRRPLKLVYSEILPSKAEAMSRELQIKKWTRDKKEALINRDTEKLHALAKRRKQ